jgi:hypothetical protein
MPYPHQPEFRYRLHCLLAVLAGALIAGAFHPGYLGPRLANPAWTAGVAAAGFLMTWLVLQFNVVVKIVSPHTVRRFSLVAFYFYAPAATVSTVVGVTSGWTRDDTLFNFMIFLPLAFAASGGAYKVYEALLPSNTSLERTRDR